MLVFKGIFLKIFLLFAKLYGNEKCSNPSRDNICRYFSFPLSKIMSNMEKNKTFSRAADKAGFSKVNKSHVPYVLHNIVENDAKQ